MKLLNFLEKFWARIDRNFNIFTKFPSLGVIHYNNRTLNIL
jgi:hypothetical protein